MASTIAKHFWDWFQHNNQQYLDYNEKTRKEQRYLIRELEWHLRRVSRKLLYAIYWGSKGNPAKLIISANGEKEDFPKVEKLIAHAPSISGWELVAFIPPSHPAIGIKDERVWQLLEDGMYFIPDEEEEEGMPSIIVYADVENARDYNMQEMVSKMVYNLLGEKTYALEMGYVDLERKLTASREVQEKWMPLEQFRSWFEEATMSSIVVTSDGAMEDIRSESDSKP